MFEDQNLSLLSDDGNTAVEQNQMDEALAEAVLAQVDVVSDVLVIAEVSEVEIEMLVAQKNDLESMVDEPAIASIHTNTELNDEN